ncbi:alpha/beta hydrolase [Gordonia sp. HY002]|uniref:alpha/beta hydrolase n=1 Tax=Gordonia zhenghanii TaxID=2911516 RepID=UPI001F43B2A7|nr:alpha/beta hydrolase [Gordonia zhenghanii]MCF8569565.1 alpha/beta hydrolase [Gordonia zhenghanii]
MITDWRPDEFLAGYEVRTLPLAPDPDGEDPINAHLVRKPGAVDAPRGAVLYVHGFTDYFFQTELADFFHDRGYAFYALDLRRCGRSLSAHHQPHYTTDLAHYDEELNAALDIVTDEVSGMGGSPRVIVAAHSTGGLVTPLWLDRLRTDDPERHGHVIGLLLNSPWLDLQGDPLLRTSAAGRLISAVGSVRGRQAIPRPLSSAYGDSLHSDVHGEWTYDLVRKPLGGFPATFGWMTAVRAGHRTVHAGIDSGVPTLVLRSDKSAFRGQYDAAVDTADCVLDVKQIAQWSGCLGQRVLAVAVPDARHDVFLSIEPVRKTAYAEVDSWMESEFGR